MEETITTLTLFNHPERFDDYVKDMRYWTIVCAYLDEQCDIDEAFLDDYLKRIKEYTKQAADDYYGNDIGFANALFSKLKALQAKPGKKQKRMNDFELFMAGNRAWGKRFSPNEIWMVNQFKGFIKMKRLDMHVLEPIFDVNLSKRERKVLMDDVREKLWD